MELQRRQFLHLAAGSAALPALSRIATAQTYPTRPVRIIVENRTGASSPATWHAQVRPAVFIFEMFDC
jgi:hypothetical protein